MPDLKKMLRDLADAYEREEEGETSAALTARIDALEAGLNKQDPTPAELESALETVTDEEWELIRAHRAGTPPPPAAAPPAAEPVKAKTRPGRKKGQAYQWTVDDAGKVQKTDIAHIYSGDDEPDEVYLAPEEEAAA